MFYYHRNVGLIFVNEVELYLENGMIFIHYTKGGKISSTVQTNIDTSGCEIWLECVEKCDFDSSGILTFF